MKYLFLIPAFILGAGSVAQAETIWGSQCGLTDSKDDSWVEVGTSLNLAGYSSIQLDALPTVTKQQVIIMAKYGAGETVDIKNIVDAVNYIKPSEGPYVSNYLVNGAEYTEILTYPGDNPVGLVFENGTTHVVAENGDDSIACR